MKSRDGKSQRREEKKKEGQKRGCLRRKKVQVREKVGKSRNTVFFQWFVAPEGRKVGSLKRRVRSQLARWEMKNDAQLWREAHFDVKMYKTPQLRTTFRKLRCWKSARCRGAKHISKSKVLKTNGFGALLDAQMSFWMAGARDYAPCQSEQNVKVLWRFLKLWQAWDICRGSGKMSFAWQAQYKRHVHQRC